MAIELVNLDVKIWVILWSCIYPFFRFNTQESSKTCAYLAESIEDPLFILFELRIFLYFIGIIKRIFLYFTGTKKEHEGGWQTGKLQLARRPLASNAGLSQDHGSVGRKLQVKCQNLQQKWFKANFLVSSLSPSRGQNNVM